MIINNFKIYTFKFSVSNNYVDLVFYDSESDSIVRFGNHQDSISLLSLYDMLMNKTNMFIGYNNTHLENPIVNYLVESRNFLKTLNFTNLTNAIISVYKRITENPPDEWKELKYGNFCSTLDLMFSMFRKSEQVGFSKCCVKHKLDVDGTIETDCRNIMSLVKDYEKFIKLKMDLSVSNHVDIIDKHSSVALQMILKNDIKKAGFKIPDVANTYREVSVTGKELCERYGINMPKEFVEYTFSNSSKTNLTIDVDGTTLKIDTGGLRHGFEPKVIHCGKDKYMFYLDVKSMFPSIVRHFGIHPESIDRGIFTKCYSKYVDRKLNAHSDEERAFYKNGINAIVGMFNNVDSWLYSPESSITVRMLSVMVMYDLISSLSGVVVMVNTDSLVMKCFKSDGGRNCDAIQHWKAKYNLGVTYNMLEQFCMIDYNNYTMSNLYNIASHGSGVFSDDSTLEPKVSVHAAVMKLLYNVSIEDTIDVEVELFDSGLTDGFDIYFNAPDGSELYLSDSYKNETNVGDSIMVVCTNDGLWLSSVNESGKHRTLCDYPVKRANDTIKPSDINKSYYIKRANCIVNKTTFVQFKLL